MFMNEFDLINAYQDAAKDGLENRRRLSVAVDSLRRWANHNSDGWAYWAKPQRATKRATELLWGRHDDDISDAEYRAALTPIKAFLTRQRADIAPYDPDNLLH